MSWLTFFQVLVFIGLLMTAIGGLGIYFYSPQNISKEDVGDAIKEELGSINIKQDIEESIEKTIYKYRDKFDYETNVQDERIRDGGKISAMIMSQGGPIIDIGNPENVAENRVFMYIEAPDKIFLELYDAYGKHYQLQGKVSITPFVQNLVEGIWSSKEDFVAILVDRKISAKMKISELTIFHDSSKYRQVIFGGSFDKSKTITSFTIKDVKIYSSKDL